jgi:membrane protein YqaA with SNARE-associated domain
MYDYTDRQRRIIGLSIFATLLIGWSIFLYFAGPTYLVETIGVTNGYLLGFLVAAIGGVSTATSISFYSVVTALAAGGLNPFGLGLIMGTGVSIGDSIFFYLGKTGRHTLHHRIQHHVDKALDWAYDQNIRLVHVIVFAWAAFMPLPNDIITVPSGISRFHAKDILPSILAGNIVFTTLLALVVRSGLLS